MGNLLKTLKKVGILIMILSFLLWFSETWYFGWNLRPESTSEYILDNVALYGFTIGFAIWWTAWREK